MSVDFVTRWRPRASVGVLWAAVLVVAALAGAEPPAGGILISPSRTDEPATRPTTRSAVSAVSAGLPTPPVELVTATSPLNLLKSAPRVQFERDGDLVTVTPTPTPPDIIEPTNEPPESAMPLDPRRPSAVSAPDGEEETGGPDPPRRRQGIVRGLLRSVPLIGPVIVREPTGRQPRRAGERMPSEAEQPDRADLAGGVAPPAERPVLFPPPPARSELADEPSTDTTDAGPPWPPKQPAMEDLAPMPGAMSAPATGVAPPGEAAAAPAVGAGSAVTPASAGSAGPLFDANDLALPNPSAEENDVLREKYTAAIVRAREGDHAGAAALLREYASSHLLSRLTPRALFLAAIMDPDPARAAESRDRLERDFPASPYVAELRRRVAAGRVPALAGTPADGPVGDRPAGAVAAPGAVSAGAAAGAASGEPTETDSEAVARLERFLTSAPVGPQTLRQRMDLCRLYLKLRQPRRAESLLRTLLPDARGRAEEAEALDLLSEYHIAEGRTDEAKRHLEALISGFPAYPAMAKVRLNMGLVSEASGNYQRALAEYRAVAAGWPETAEAALARDRIRDVESLLD